MGGVRDPTPRFKFLVSQMLGETLTARKLDIFSDSDSGQILKAGGGGLVAGALFFFGM